MKMDDTSQTTTPPTMQCPSCNTQAQWLPNGQLWCSHCLSVVAVRGRNDADTAKIGGLIVGVILIVLAILWFTGKFDSTLISAGMPELATQTNCAKNFFGVVMCGEELERFCKENYDADLNGHVCSDVLGNSATQPNVDSGATTPPPDVVINRGLDEAEVRAAWIKSATADGVPDKWAGCSYDVLRAHYPLETLWQYAEGFDVDGYSDSQAFIDDALSRYKSELHACG